MEIVYEKFNQFQRQCHSEKDMIKIQELNQQINRLEQLKLERSSSLLPSDKKDIEKYIKIYRYTIRQIQRMKMQFTKPSLVKQRLAQIFDSEDQQINLQVVMEKTSQIRSSQIEIPTFKKKISKENVIDLQSSPNDFGSPGLRSFFQKKQAQIMNRTQKSNFKSVVEENKSFSKQNRSVSRQQPSHVSRSSANSFLKKPTHESQLKKILQENKKIKEEYERKLKRQLQLGEFEKNLLKEQKNRYMLKIEELESQLENLYRANYKLKEEVSFKEKQIKERAELDNSSSFRNVDENVAHQSHDYYQPYVMKTKHNDLKRLNMKCLSEIDEGSVKNRVTDNNFFPVNNGANFIAPVKSNQEPIDILGNELQKQLKQMEKERSRSNNNSRHSSKKWSKDYNAHLYGSGKGSQKNRQENDDLLNALRDDDSVEEIKSQLNSREPVVQFKQPKIGSKGYVEVNSKNPFQKKHEGMMLNNLNLQSGHQINIRPPSQLLIQAHPPSSVISSRKYLPQSKEQLTYSPLENYSLTRQVNRDYSINSASNSYDTFDMTRTFVNVSQNEQSQTNKYIDSKTSTRNKVAFFKDSLILLKNDQFELAYKRSALVKTKDRVRVIFFVRNKTSQVMTVNFRYDFDAGYFKLKVNEKLQTVPPYGQARQDLEVYAFSTQDLNEVIDVIVNVDFDKYGLWMPIIWMDFSQVDNFKLPSNCQEISIIPDRQFKNFDTAKTIMPLMSGGVDGDTSWGYLYADCKFGPCYIKLTWENKQLKIQSNPKWLDLLAFVMHHVK